MMEINKAGLDLIKEFEGLRLKAYLDPIGIPTIGYGTTTRADVGIKVEMGMEISEAEAEMYLKRALDKFAARIAPKMTRTPTPNQFAAMLSLAYNIGPGAFSRSTCLKRFNASDIKGAAEALTWFNKAGGKVWNGLVRRRAAEKALFLADSLVAADPHPTTPITEGRDSPLSSTTLQAAAAAVVSGGTGVATAVSKLEGTAQITIIVAAVIALAALAWVARERLRKWGEGIK